MYMLEDTTKLLFQQSTCYSYNPNRYSTNSHSYLLHCYVVLIVSISFSMWSEKGSIRSGRHGSLYKGLY